MNAVKESWRTTVFKKPSEPNVHTRTSRIIFVLGCVIAIVLYLTGCATVKQSATTEIRSPDGTVEIRTTDSRISAVFDSKNAVGSVRASNGKTQSLGAKDVSEETASPVKDITELLKVVRPVP